MEPPKTKIDELNKKKFDFEARQEKERLDFIANYEKEKLAINQAFETQSVIPALEDSSHHTPPLKKETSTVKGCLTTCLILGTIASLGWLMNMLGWMDVIVSACVWVILICGVVILLKKIW